MPPQMDPFYKPKNVSIDIEDIELNVWYAFTINPTDEHQYFGCKEDERIDNFKKYISQLLYITFNKYEFYFEISKMSRMHVHGKVLFKDMKILKRYYVEKLPRLLKIGTICMKTIKEADKEEGMTWDKYITKQYKIWDIKFTSEDKLNKSFLTDIKVEYVKIPMEDDI